MKNRKITITLISRDAIKLDLTPVGYKKFFDAVNGVDRFYYVEAEFNDGFKGYIDLNLDNILFIHESNEQ
mgnify:CR=1 FL=1|tara:strand:- start:982 stop:1191 length:210 start_codon:yes stop_codon:yes gene_type:complete